MAPGKPSPFSAQELASDQFVESCGAILFDLADSRNKKVCIIQPSYSKEYLLAKGRRNLGESRQNAALREVMEETGYRCRLFPVSMPTRATLSTARPDIKDKARTHENVTEPIWCTIRQMKNRTKIIWWYIAALEEDGDAGKLPGEIKYRPLFVSCNEALSMLTYESDRALVAKAVELVDATIFGRQVPQALNERIAEQSTTKPTKSQKQSRRKKRAAEAKRQAFAAEADRQRAGGQDAVHEEEQELGKMNHADQQVEFYEIST